MGKTIEFRKGITIELGVNRRNIYESGTIKSNLKEFCPDCGGTGDCTCVAIGDLARYNAAIDGIESFLLALAVAGVDVTQPSIKEAFETAVEAAANNIS